MVFVHEWLPKVMDVIDNLEADLTVDDDKANVRTLVKVEEVEGSKVQKFHETYVEDHEVEVVVHEVKVEINGVEDMRFRRGSKRGVFENLGGGIVGVFGRD
ncbi:hypothetical protein L1887_37881 [Cichorium endivia]|nr:hypothetical protein L1887_37881 [Cichorium endivia]